MNNINLATESVKKKFKNREKEHFSKTIMLLLVCILLFFAELPHAFLLFISILDENNYFNFYKPLGDLFDCWAMTNYLINFLIYCCMSESFRKEFYKFFKI